MSDDLSPGETPPPEARPKPSPKDVDRVVLRFAGDSGDGMQLTGSQFTTTAAVAGNDLATFPDFPAEIRAPAGTLAGVSGFQISFADFDIHTAGDQPDLLVAMNPAALKANLGDLPDGATIIVNADAFDARGLDKAGCQTNPLEDGSLEAFRVLDVRLTSFTRNALEALPLTTREKDRCKNFFALGMTYYLYQHPLGPTRHWIEEKFASRPLLAEANRQALEAGYAYCEATEIFEEVYRVAPANFPTGTYRNITGNSALSIGLVTAAEKAGRRLFLGSYPITPASSILHELSRLKEHGVITFQAEDEIAAICSAIGAAYGGALAVTSSSGPGVALKTEALGLAVMTELPLVLVNVQRGGPSTGLPTKTEQADLFQALFGRNGECPVPVLAACTPGDCFDVAIEACRIALQSMSPVILLSDGYLANSSEPWRIPDPDTIAPIAAPQAAPDPEAPFLPYARDPESLARPWALPGRAGLEHRIGGLEKEDGTGHVSYDGANHERMVRRRAEKIARIANTLPPTEIEGVPAGKLLILGWGSTDGQIRGALRRLRAAGHEVGHVQLRYLNPLPSDLLAIISRYEEILVPELNLGQLALLLRAHARRDVVSFSKVQGRPFSSREIEDRALDLLGAGRTPTSEGKP